MAGIVISTKKRILLDKKIKEVQVPSGVLDTAMYYADLPALGVNPSIPTLDYELGRLPTIVKNEASMALVYGAITNGKTYGINGDTKSVEGFTFSRNSGATRWAFDGKIYPAAINELRSLSDPKTGSFKGMLFEKASTNLLTHSGFTRGLVDIASKSDTNVSAVDTGWNKGGLLDKGISLVQHATSLTWAYKSFLNALPNTAYTFSCFVKMSDGLSPMGGLKVAMFNNLFSDFSVEDVGSGVYRLSITKSISNIGNNLIGIVKDTVGDSRSFIVTGYQLEEANFSSSYIPTDSASVTRLEDILQSERPIDIFNEYSVFLRGSYQSSKTELQSSMFVVKDLNSRYWFHTYSSVDPSNIRSYNGVVGLRAVANEIQEHNVVIRRNLNDFSMCVNGGAVQTDNNVFPLVEQRFTIRGSNASFTLRALAIIPRKLTDLELQTITT